MATSLHQTSTALADSAQQRQQQHSIYYRFYKTRMFNLNEQNNVLDPTPPADNEAVQMEGEEAHNPAPRRQHLSLRFG